LKKSTTGEHEQLPKNREEIAFGNDMTIEGLGKWISWVLGGEEERCNTWGGEGPGGDDLSMQKEGGCQ